MRIQDFLSANDVDLDVRATDKSGLLRALAARAAAVLGLPAATIAAELEKRDQLGSTGIGGGVSMPHARFREIGKPFGMLVRLAQPIDFASIDAKPVDVVFLLILPAASQLDQLNALAAVARLLRNPEAIARLRHATSKAELYEAVTGDGKAEAIP